MRWLPMVNSPLLAPPTKSGAPLTVRGAAWPVFSSTVQASVRCFTVSVFTCISLL